jgi:hypothetical protein
MSTRRSVRIVAEKGDSSGQDPRADSVTTSKLSIDFKTSTTPLRTSKRVTVHSPDDNELFSPGFTLASPVGGLPPATATLPSALITPSIFDAKSSFERFGQVNQILLMNRDFINSCWMCRLKAISSRRSKSHPLRRESLHCSQQFMSCAPLKNQKTHMTVHRLIRSRLSPKPNLDYEDEMFPLLCNASVRNPGVWSSTVTAFRPRSTAIPRVNAMTASIRKITRRWVQWFDAATYSPRINNIHTQARSDALSHIAERKPAIFRSDLTPKVLLTHL